VVLLAALAVGLSSCGVWYNFKAYFNSYYNAKVLFEQVEDNMASLPVELFSYREPTIMAQDYLTLTKVNEKCSKILQFDSQSGYFIDALWLSGKAFYYQKDYIKAERKFKELLNIEQDSAKLVEVNLWLGKTELQLRNFDQANKRLDQVALDAVRLKESDLFTQAVIKQIAYLIYKEKYAEAIEKCNEFIKNSKDDEKRAEVAYELGKFYYKSNDYEKASAAFKSVSDYSPAFETGFRSKLEYAKCMLDLGKLEEGMSLLNDLKNKSQYSKYLDEILVELGTGHYLKKDFAKAMDVFTNVDTLYYGAKSSGVSEYMKAQIYEYHLINFDSALTYYESANQNGLLSDEMKLQIAKKANVFGSYSRSKAEILKDQKQILYQTDKANFLRDSVLYVEAVYRDTVGQRFGRIANQTYSPTQLAQGQSGQNRSTLGGLNDTQTQNQAQQSTFTSQTNQNSLDQQNSVSGQNTNQQGQKLGLSSGQSNTQGYRNTQKRVVKKKPLPPKPEFIKITVDSLQTNLAGKLFGLANIFFNDMDLPDSAIYYYKEILSAYPKKSIIPETYYALGTVYSTTNQKEKADSLFKIVYSNYKDTPLALSAAKKLGLIEEAPKNDPAENFYTEAEKKYYNKNYNEAISDFRSIVEKYPKSRFAPKSAYYVAFIFENDLKNIDSTTTAYEYLTNKYPDSDAARRAQKHHVFYQDEKKKKTKDKPIQPVNPSAVPAVLQNDQKVAADSGKVKQTNAKTVQSLKPQAQKEKDARPSADAPLNVTEKVKDGELPSPVSLRGALKDEPKGVRDSVKSRHPRFKDDDLVNPPVLNDTFKAPSKVLPDSIKAMIQKGLLQDSIKAKQKKAADSTKAVKESLK
jgi:TolA-binding protein